MYATSRDIYIQENLLKINKKNKLTRISTQKKYDNKVYHVNKYMK